MCGIAGWIGRHPAAEAHARELATALHHRGPDGRNIRLWDDACLVHTRLRIIDLSIAASQPMPNETGSIWTVFNGEIYNHHELRRWLDTRGHVFRSQTDAEVIPHLYEELGPAFVERLRGMFALGVLDLREHRLLLARDRFGVKPLFFASLDAPDGPALAFASEIRPLRLLPGVDQRTNMQAVSDFLALSFIPAPETFFTGIHSIEPGEMLEARWDSAGVSFQTRPYHQWSIAPQHNLTMAEALNKTQELLASAVGSQIESDVPLGALLSGGIDSSLISTLAHQATSDSLRTYNVHFADEEYDETPSALAVSAHAGTRHQTLEMGSVGLDWDDACDLLTHMGQPFGDTSVFGVHAISRLMRQHVTVALSGDGGDEAYGGYSTFAQIEPASRYLSLPKPLRRLTALAATGAQGIHLVRAAEARAARELRDGDDATMLEYLLCWIRPKEHASLIHEHDLLPVRRHFEPRWRREFGLSVSALERLSALTTEVRARLIMAGDYLPKVDMASMKESLEVRVPMLDEALFQYGLNLPHRLKTRKRRTKVVLRGVARRTIPEAVAEMPKHGFGVPVDKLVDVRFRQMSEDRLLDPSCRLAGILEPNAYRPVLRAFCDQTSLQGVSRAGIYQRAIMLLSLDLCLEDSPVKPTRATSSTAINSSRYSLERPDACLDPF